MKSALLFIMLLWVGGTANANTRILVLDAKAQGVDEKSASTLTTLTTQRLSDLVQAEVLSHSDLNQLVGLKAMKMAADCDESGCLSEIADALSAEFVVTGEVGTLGQTLVYQIRVFDQLKSEVISRKTLEASSFDALRAQVPDALSALVAPLINSGKIQAQTATPVQGSVLPVVGWSLLGAGTLGAIVSAGAIVFGEMSVDDKSNPLEARKNWQTAGPYLVGGLALSLVAMGAGLGTALLTE